MSTWEKQPVKSWQISISTSNEGHTCFSLSLFSTVATHILRKTTHFMEERCNTQIADSSYRVISLFHKPQKKCFKSVNHFQIYFKIAGQYYYIVFFYLIFWQWPHCWTDQCNSKYFLWCLLSRWDNHCWCITDELCSCLPCGGKWSVSRVTIVLLPTIANFCKTVCLFLINHVTIFIQWGCFIM